MIGRAACGHDAGWLAIGYLTGGFMARGSEKRRINRLPPERRISDITNAAQAIFTEKGYSEALIADIAERAGVVEGSIYRFFSNKRELLIKVVERWFEELLETGTKELSGIFGTRNLIRCAVQHHLEAIKREPALARLMLQEIRPDPRYRQLRLFTLNQAYTQRIVDIIRAGQESGELRADASPSLVRDMIFGSIEHRTWAFLRQEGDFEPGLTAEAITDMVYGGIATRPADRQASSDDTLARLEAVTARLETLADDASTHIPKRV